MINAKGQVVFSIGTGGGRTTTFFHDTTAVPNIGTAGGSEVEAADVNDVGQVEPSRHRIGQPARLCGGLLRRYLT